MFIYVRGLGGGDTNYHWCQNCPNYPKTFSHSTARRPRVLLCPACERSEREETCEE